MNKYSNTKFFRLESRKTGQFYLGFCRDKLSRKKANFTERCKMYDNGKIKFKPKYYDIIKENDYDIILINKFDLLDIEDARQKEYETLLPYRQDSG